MAKKKSRLGRKPLPEKEKRKERIRIYLNEQEYALFEQAVQASGILPTEWTRAVVMKEAKKVTGKS